MNIHLYSHNGNVEGAPIMLSILAQELQKKGHLCHMILNAPGILEGVLKNMSVHYSIALDHFSDPSLLFTHEKPDLIIVNTILGFHIVEEAKNSNIPVLWIIHESDKAFLENGVEAAHFQSANAVIFPSEFTHALYAEFDTGNFHVIHNGLPVDRIQSFTETHTKEALRKQYNIPLDATVFLSVGTHQELKGHDRFVEASIKLMKKYPQKNIHCIVAGSIPSAFHQEITDSLLKTAWKYNVRKNVHVYGDFPLIYDLYALSDFYVCASDMETFPMTVLEAMAFRLPTVACNVGGIPEQITEPCEGILVTPHSVEALAEGMDTLLDNTAQTELIRDTAQTKILNTLNATQMCDHYIALIDSLSLIPNQESSRNTAGSIALVIQVTPSPHIQNVIRAAIATFPYYSECIFVVSENISKDMLTFLQEVPLATILSITQKNHTYEDMRYQAFDMCQSKWIVYTDAKDLWVSAPDVHNLSDTVGCIYGQYIMLNQITSDANQRCILQSDKTHGPLWIMRNTAWKSISKSMQKQCFCPDIIWQNLHQKQWESQYCNTHLGIHLH